MWREDIKNHIRTEGIIWSLIKYGGKTDRKTKKLNALITEQFEYILYQKHFYEAPQMFYSQNDAGFNLINLLFILQK
jgi:hypothetical protein